MSIILDGTIGVTTPNIISPTQTISTRLDLTGGQIKFPATQVPSSDANTLDDYEEGTWTPVWSCPYGTNPTLGNGTIVGRYIKIGNFVVATISLSGGSTTNYGSGWYAFSLPFSLAFNDDTCKGTGLVSNNGGVNRYLLGTEVKSSVFLGVNSGSGGYGIFSNTVPVAMDGVGTNGLMNFHISYML